MASLSSFFCVNMLTMFLNSALGCIFFLPFMAISTAQAGFSMGEVLTSGQFFSDFAKLANQIIIPAKDLLVYITVLYVMLN
jgi:hypothetical protein